MMKHPYALTALVLCLSTTVAACAFDSTADVEDEKEDQTASATHALTTSPERALSAKLGLPSRFAIGLGNDQEGGDPNSMASYSMGLPINIHYLYLSGLPGEGGWTDWNSPSGQYLTMHANAAKARGIVPMFTLYQAAAWGENNLSAFNNSTYMTKYWRGVRTMFEKLAGVNVPAIAHIEPDLWGYFQKMGGDNPAAVAIKVSSLVPECSDLPNNVAGFGKCIVRLGRGISPKVAIALHASSFGAYTNGSSDTTRIGNYLRNVGGAEADMIVVETLDRDAGCFEVGSDANCKRSGSFYWDEANVRHPNFHDHLGWAKGIRNTSGKPLLWWQMPLGAPSSTSGWSGKYRDNRVRYLFSHGWEFAQAGGIGAVFGTGAPNQTTVRTDGGQFKNALSSYLSYGGNGLN
jgi:hypothetical protein